jgi:hypothetical protein
MVQQTFIKHEKRSVQPSKTHLVTNLQICTKPLKIIQQLKFTIPKKLSSNEQTKNKDDSAKIKLKLEI